MANSSFFICKTWLKKSCIVLLCNQVSLQSLASYGCEVQTTAVQRFCDNDCEEVVECVDFKCMQQYYFESSSASLEQSFHSMYWDCLTGECYVFAFVIMSNI